jgi:hypothetical protein
MEDLQTEPYVMIREVETGAGEAEATISIYDEDHRFDIWVSDDESTAIVEYQESLTFRGMIRVSDPDPSIYKELMVSDPVTEFLDEYGCDSVKRAETP